jgi:predicted RNA-binding Zn-ribbon protein involved in translation (DUF1610 family)
MFTLKKKCTACGQRFAPDKAAIYTARKPQGFFEGITAPVEMYDAMDCPRCGCQNALAVRMPKVPAEPDAAEGEQC